MVIVELKSVEEIHPVHKKQVLTYLRLTKLKLGYLLNFGNKLMKDGITRVINGDLSTCLESSVAPCPCESKGSVPDVRSPSDLLDVHRADKFD